MANEPTLKKLYKEQVVPQLMKEFNYSTVMQCPKIEKIVLNQKDLFALKAVRRRGRLLLFHAVGLREHVAQLGHEQRHGEERRHTCLARLLLDVRPVIGR